MTRQLSCPFSSLAERFYCPGNRHRNRVSVSCQTESHSSSVAGQLSDGLHGSRRWHHTLQIKEFDQGEVCAAAAAQLIAPLIAATHAVLSMRTTGHRVRPLDAGHLSCPPTSPGLVQC